MFEIIIAIQLVLVFLKVVGAITWEWYQVLAPCWCSGLILLVFFGISILGKIND